MRHLKKRIFLRMMLLSVVSLLVVSIALCFIFYGQLSEKVHEELKNRTETFSDNTHETAVESLSSTNGADARVTVIMPDGTVVFDNTAKAASLPNHADRIEIKNAFESGSGQSTRFSDTMDAETYYYAVRLTDGYVLRMAKTTGSIWSVFAGALPIVFSVMFAVILICYFLASKLTKSIVEPINNVQPDTAITSPYDELAPFIRTITDQRERIAAQMESLEDRANTISAITENMNEGLILLGRRGIILSANKSALRIFDATASMDGKNILELLRDLELLEHARAALAGERGEMNVERGDKTYRAYFSPVKTGGAMVLLLDITERTGAEKMRREFSANVSHELKTPLTSIYGHAEMLLGGMIKEGDKAAFYAKIKDEAARLISLIEDIILISRLDEGAEHETFEDVNLAETAAEAAEALSQKAGENGVEVIVSSGDAHMSANRSQMYEMFFNLVDNAIKYNQPGGTVKINIENADGQIIVSVTDTGIGIPKESKERVFERFYRVDKSRSKKTGGTGLGLAIVKHIVMTHGGKIELESKSGKGTTIKVVFEKWQERQ